MHEPPLRCQRYPRLEPPNPLQNVCCRAGGFVLSWARCPNLVAKRPCHLRTKNWSRSNVARLCPTSLCSTPSFTCQSNPVPCSAASRFTWETRSSSCSAKSAPRQKTTGCGSPPRKSTIKSLRHEFPHMRSIQLLGKEVTGWQVLPADAPDFESAALRACELIVARDPRIGKVPKSRRR